MARGDDTKQEREVLKRLLDALAPLDPEQRVSVIEQLWLFYLPDGSYHDRINPETLPAPEDVRHYYEQGNWHTLCGRNVSKTDAIAEEILAGVKRASAEDCRRCRTNIPELLRS